MGQTTSTSLDFYREVSPAMLKEECDVTRLFPKIHYLRCGKDDALFSYSIPLEQLPEDQVHGKYVLVSKTSNLNETLQKVADLARFCRCHNFVRYEKSFFCKSAKAMTKLGCRKFGESAYFTVVGNYQTLNLKLMQNNMNYEEFLCIFVQLCYALQELDFANLRSASVNLNDIGLKLNPRVSIFVLPSGKIFSFERGYFPVLLNFDSPETTLASKFSQLRDDCSRLFSDPSIRSFLRGVSSVSDVFENRDVQRFAGVKVIYFPSQYILSEDALPEPLLRPYFAVSSRQKSSVAQISNKLLGDWMKNIEETLEKIESRPVSYDQMMIVNLEKQIRELGHPNLMDVLSRLSRISSKTTVTREKSQVYQLVGEIESLIYRPNFEGERLMALERIVALYDYILLQNDQILADAATSFIDIYLLDKLSKELRSREPSEELRRSKLSYARKIYEKLRNNPFVPKELVRLLGCQENVHSQLVYGSTEWFSIRQPESIIKDPKKESEISPVMSLFLTYLSSVRVGTAFPGEQRRPSGVGMVMYVSESEIPKDIVVSVEMAKIHRDSELENKNVDSVILPDPPVPVSVPPVPLEVSPEITRGPEPKKEEERFPMPSNPFKSSIEQYVELGRPKDFKNPKILVFTSYTGHTKDRLMASRMVAANQRAFAKQKGYRYEVFEENLAKKAEEAENFKREKDIEPYWSKIAGIREKLADPETETEWIVWLDDDAIITNPDYRFEDVLDYYTSQQDDLDFIVTTDSSSHGRSDVPLNSAVLFVRNTDWSRKFFDDVWETRNQRVMGEDYTYSDCPNQSCLHEQQVITELLVNPKYAKHSKIIDQRDVKDPVGGWGINTFKRQSHFDVQRQFRLVYDNDQFVSKPGDMITQCTGLSQKGFRNPGEITRNLRKECIVQTLEDVEKRYPEFAKEENLEEFGYFSEVNFQEQRKKVFEELGKDAPGVEYLEYFTDRVTSENLGVQIESADIKVTNSEIDFSYKLSPGFGVDISYDRKTGKIVWEADRSDLDSIGVKIYKEANEGNEPRMKEVVTDDESAVNARLAFSRLMKFSERYSLRELMDEIKNPEDAERIFDILKSADKSYNSVREDFLQQLDRKYARKGHNYGKVYFDALVNYLGDKIDSVRYKNFGELSDYFNILRELLQCSDCPTFSSDSVQEALQFALKLSNAHFFIGRKKGNELILDLISYRTGYDEAYDLIRKNEFSEPEEMAKIREALPYWYRMKRMIS